MSRRKMFYIVRLREDDSIVAVGSAEECSRIMDMTVNSFRATVSRCRSGKNQKYEIDVEPEDQNGGAEYGTSL